jgi:hypothetical protein
MSGHLTEVTQSQEEFAQELYREQTDDKEESRTRGEAGCAGYPPALERHRRQLFGKNLQAPSSQ